MCFFIYVYVCNSPYSPKNHIKKRKKFYKAGGTGHLPVYCRKCLNRLFNLSQSVSTCMCKSVCVCTAFDNLQHLLVEKEPYPSVTIH